MVSSWCLFGGFPAGASPARWRAGPAPVRAAGGLPPARGGPQPGNVGARKILKLSEPQLHLQSRSLSPFLNFKKRLQCRISNGLSTAQRARAACFWPRPKKPNPTVKAHTFRAWAYSGPFLDAVLQFYSIWARSPMEPHGTPAEPPRKLPRNPHGTPRNPTEPHRTHDM